MISGIIPSTWKYSKLTVLSKPINAHTALKGYSVIPMANVWVKVCEKIAAARLSAEQT